MGSSPISRSIFSLFSFMSFTKSKPFSLTVLSPCFAVCRLEPNTPTPHWVDRKYFHCITHTESELTIVCQQDQVPLDVKAERDWNIIRVNGVLDFGLTGILASISTPLAEASISIFAISTFDTDYILVRKQQLAQAKKALTDAGFEFT